MKPQLFGLFDILFGAGWLVVILIVFWWYRVKNKHQPHFKFFYPHLLFKIGLGLFFGITYAIILPYGGDTLAYWDGAVTLNHLFWDNPSAYFAELLQTPSRETMTTHFNLQTGYPPSWIYVEPESFFVCKIASLFTFISFNSYVALTLIFSTFATISSWKLFELLRTFKFCSQTVIALATLFIPTVAFWCSGISKDTLVLSLVYLYVYYFFSMLTGKKKVRFWNVIKILFTLLLLYHLRSFMVVAVGIPTIIALLVKSMYKFNNNPALMFTVRGLFVIFSILTIMFYFRTEIDSNSVKSNEYLEEVMIIQKDFAGNKLYTGPRYDLGIDEYTFTGFIKATPISIITAFYRPFIWEANSGFLFLSGIEGTLLIVLTLGFFFKAGNLSKHFRYIQSQEFLMFALVFAIILGIFVGFTSGLYNVLVRFKAPLMMFLILFFAARKPALKEEKIDA